MYYLFWVSVYRVAKTYRTGGEGLQDLEEAMSQTAVFTPKPEQEEGKGDGEQPKVALCVDKSLGVDQGQPSDQSHMEAVTSQNQLLETYCDTPEAHHHSLDVTPPVSPSRRVVTTSLRHCSQGSLVTPQICDNPGGPMSLPGCGF